MLERNGEVEPVEVKSSRGATKSLNEFVERFEPQTAYKLIDGNAGHLDGKITLPQFMAMFL